jgi:capsular polysaccharide biosynthesis protein
MELDRYLRILGRYWFIPALLVIVSIVGTWCYLQWSGGGALGSVSWTGASTATATVAVLEPAVTRASSGQQAQINFASIAESQTVGERVRQRLGLDERTDVPPPRVAVKLARTLVPSVPTPLYYIQVQHKDPELALAVADAYVDEARQLFIELNALEPRQVDAALEGEESRIRSDLDQARAALRAFEDANDAWRLSSRIETQAAFINTLRQTARTADIGGATASAARTDAERSLTSAQSDLTRLRGLQPDYDRLSLDVTLATSTLSQLTARESELALGNDVGALNSVRAEMDAVRARLSQARTALSDFQRSNGIGDLSAEIAARNSTVSDLRRQILTSSSSISGLNTVIDSEEAELQRLRSLQPEYDKLAAPVTTGEAKLGQLQLKKVDIVVAGSLPPEVLVKVLDPPYLQSNAVGAVVLYILGIALGILGGAVLVYVVGYFDRTIESAEQTEQLVGAPVLVRVTRAR